MIPLELRTERQSQTPFEQALLLGEQDHDRVLIERFEKDPNPYNNQDYHTKAHGEAVARRTEHILQQMHQADPTFVTKRDIQLGKYIAKGHDRVQKWDPTVVKVGDVWVVKRKRLLGENERETAKEMVAFMAGINTTYGAEVFTMQDMATVVEAEDCTIPTFDPNLMTVVQKSLTKDTSPIARAIALADTGGAGMDGPNVFNDEGRKLFREENLDVREAIRRGYPLSREWRDYIAWRIIGWGDSQASWVLGRKEMLETELDGLPEQVKQAVRPLFDKFDMNLQATQKLRKLRRSLSFDQLIRETGYTT